MLYHRPRSWPYPTDLLSLMDGPDKRFLPYIPDFSFVLLDLSEFSEEDIKGVVQTYLENKSGKTLLELGERILEWDSFDRVEEWLSSR